jgi:hypothetical protein
MCQGAFFAQSPTRFQGLWDGFRNGNTTKKFGLALRS